MFGIGAIAVASATQAGEITEYQTSLGDKLNHPNIVVRVSKASILSIDVNKILDGFEDEIKNGVKYKAGETIQLGFTLNQFSELEDGRLLLEEPDMVSLPIKFVPSMNFTFQTLRNQKDVVESISNVNLTFPTLRQAIAVHKDYKVSKAVMLERIAPEDGQSGWWLHVQGDSVAEDFSLISLYEFAMGRPDLVKFLALPVGAKAYQIDGAPIQVSINDVEVMFEKGSYISELNKLKQG